MPFESSNQSILDKIYKLVIDEESLRINESDTPETVFKKFKNTMIAALSAPNPQYFVGKLARKIAKLNKLSTATDVIESIFNQPKSTNDKIKKDQINQLAYGLIAVLNDIAEEQSSEQTKELESRSKINDDPKQFLLSQIQEADLIRKQGRNPAEAALKALCRKLLLTDEQAIATYRPVLYPEFYHSFSILLFDVIRLRYLSGKTGPIDLYRDQRQLFDETFSQLVKKAEGYLQAVADRTELGYAKIWPSGIKGPFSSYYQSLTRIHKYMVDTLITNKTTESKKTISIKQKDGKLIDIESWVIGYVALFGTMIGTRTVFADWFQNIKELLKNKPKEAIEQVFSNSELLCSTSKTILFDFNFFYPSICDLQTKYNSKQKSTQNMELLTIIKSEEFKTAYKQAIKGKLKNYLGVENYRSKIKDGESEFANELEKWLDDYKDEIPSRKFFADFNEKITAQAEKIIAKRARRFFANKIFVNLVNQLPNLKLPESTDERNNIITIMLDAVFNNSPKSLEKLDSQYAEFKSALENFLNTWGDKLQSLLPHNTFKEKFKKFVFGVMLKYGLKKEAILAKMKEDLGDSFTIDELPQMIEGINQLSDKALVDTLRQKVKDPKLAEKLNMARVNEILYDKRRVLFRNVEDFILDSELLAVHFKIIAKILRDKGQTNFKDFERTQKKWIDFINDMLPLFKAEDFKAAFDTKWKDNKNFRKHLTAIASNPALYIQYDFIILYISAKIYSEKLTEEEKELLLCKANGCIGHVYDMPTQTAAKSLINEGHYTVDQIVLASDDSTKKFVNKMMRLGVESKVEDPVTKQKKEYPSVLAQLNSSFIDFDMTQKRTASPVTAFQEAYYEECKEDIRIVLNHLNSLSDEEISIVVNLAIDTHNDKIIKNTVRRIGEVKPEVLKKIASNIADQTLQDTNGNSKVEIDGNILAFLKSISTGNAMSSTSKTSSKDSSSDNKTPSNSDYHSNDNLVTKSEKSLSLAKAMTEYLNKSDEDNFKNLKNSIEKTSDSKVIRAFNNQLRDFNKNKAYNKLESMAKILIWVKSEKTTVFSELEKTINEIYINLDERIALKKMFEKLINFQSFNLNKQEINLLVHEPKKLNI